jgi:hypothetical protein
MEITGHGSATGGLRFDFPTVLISRPAISISFHPIRNKQLELDAEVKQSVTSWLQKLSTYLM